MKTEAQIKETIEEYKKQIKFWEINNTLDETTKVGLIATIKTLIRELELVLIG